MKREALILTALCLSLLFAAGCGSAEKKPSSITGTGKAQEAQTENASESIQESEADKETAGAAETAGTETEAEAGDPAETEETEAAVSDKTYKVVFDAYAEELMAHEDVIRNVSWQNKYTIGWLDDISTKYGREPVAMTDICGDDTPELIYLGARTDYSADLNILTYENGSLKPLSFSENYDIQVAGGARFMLFKKNEDNKLYSYYSMGDENWTRTWSVFEQESDGQYKWRTLAKEESGPDENYTTTLYDYSDEYGAITKEDYDNTAGDLISNMGSVVICENIDDQKIYDKSVQLDYLAMSYNDAMGFIDGTWTFDDRDDQVQEGDNDSEPARDSDPEPADVQGSSSGSEGMLFPDSDSRYLTSGDIRGLSSSEIQAAINEIYARHGYVFKDSELLAKYSSYSWYHKVEDDMEVVSRYFNAYESANVEFLISNK